MTDVPTPDLDTAGWTNVLARRALDAQHALHDAATAWLVRERRAIPYEGYEPHEVWTMIDQFYPGGQTAFRADPVAAVAVET